MNILSDLDDIIEATSAKEVVMAIDEEWTRTQIEEFNSVYHAKGGAHQPTHIDMFGNELEVGDWILCMRDTHGGGQTFDLNRIKKFGKSYISCLLRTPKSKATMIRPNACIKTSIEGFQKIKEIYSQL